MVTEPKDQGVGVDNMRGLDSKVEFWPSIINQIIRELKTEDMEGKVSNKISITHNAEKDLENLKIQMNQEGLSSPKYGKVKGKRSRRSLKELKEANGLSRE